MIAGRRAHLVAVLGALAAACGGAKAPAKRAEDRLRSALPHAIDIALYVDVRRLRSAIGDEAFRKLGGHESDPALRAISATLAARGTQVLVGFRGLPPDDVVVTAVGDFADARALLTQPFEADPAHPGEYLRPSARGRTEAAFLEVANDRLVVATSALVEATSLTVRGLAAPSELDPPRDAPIGLAMRPRKPFPGLGLPKRVSASVEAYPRGIEARVVAVYGTEDAAETALRRLSELVAQIRKRADDAGVVARGIDIPTRVGLEVSTHVRLPLSLFTDRD